MIDPEKALVVFQGKNIRRKCFDEEIYEKRKRMNKKQKKLLLRRKKRKPKL